MSHQLRLVAVCISLFSLLFTQLAVAAYVCPMTMAAAGMKDCANMAMPDIEQPSLCHAHAHTHDSVSKQALDKPDLPDVQLFVVALVWTLHALDVSAIEQLSLRSRSVLSDFGAPPIAVRHCCFRI